MIRSRQIKCNEGIGDSLKNVVNYIKNKYDDFKKSTAPVGIESIDGIKSLGKNYNNYLKGSNGWKAARKLMMIMDGLGRFNNDNVKIKCTTKSEAGVTSVDHAIERFRDNYSDGKASKDAFKFVDSSDEDYDFIHSKYLRDNPAAKKDESDYDYVYLVYINGSPNTNKAEKKDNIIMTIKIKKNVDNNSLSRKRLEWRVARLERLVYEKYNRVF